ncbi:hypothetical protein GCM10027417_21160 [Glutamicibacter endophyticus]
MGQRRKDDPNEWHGQHIVSEAELSFSSDAAAKRRRRLRQNWVFGVLAVLVLAVFALAYAVFTGVVTLPGQAAPAPRSEQPQIENPSCPDLEFTPPPAAEVSVRVINATTRGGLASRTSQDLVERGFDIHAATSGSSDYAEQTGAVIAGPKGYAAALAIQRQVPNAVFVFDENRTDAIVDLELGAEFESLARERKVATGPGTLRCAQ